MSARIALGGVVAAALAGCECTRLPDLVFVCEGPACDGGTDAGADAGTDAGSRDWAIAIDDPQSSFMSISDIELLPSGGFVLAANYSGTIDFGALGSRTSISQRPLVIWLDDQGVYQQVTAFSGGGSGNVAHTFGAVVHATGQTLVCGSYDESGLTFPDGTAASVAGHTNGFCAAITAGGAAMDWAVTMSGGDGGSAEALQPELNGEKGHYFVAGVFSGALSIGDAGAPGRSAPGQLWWTSLGDLGQVISPTTLDCGDAGTAEPGQIAFAGSELYFAGFTTGCQKLSTAARGNTFFVAHDLGTGVMVTVFPGLTATGNNLTESRPALALTKQSLWIAAQFTGTYTVGDAGFTSVPSSEPNVLLARLDPQSLELLDAVHLSGARSGVRLLRTVGDTIYLGGWFEGAGFGVGADRLDSTDGGRDIFLARLDPSGDVFMTRLGGAGETNLGGFVVGEKGSATIAGKFLGSLEVPGRVLVSRSAAASGFVVQLPLK